MRAPWRQRAPKILLYSLVVEKHQELTSSLADQADCNHYGPVKCMRSDGLKHEGCCEGDTSALMGAFVTQQSKAQTALPYKEVQA